MGKRPVRARSAFAGTVLRMSCAVSSITEQRLVEAVCRGDGDAFRRLVEPHRPGLHAHCYRTVGSLHDAEDAVQDGLLRVWRGLCGFEGRSSLRGDVDEIVSLLTEGATLATPEHAESHDGGDLRNFPRFRLPDEPAA